jgi:ketosteroid isomerase-like protein
VSSSGDQVAIAELLELEQLRCEALANDDYAGLREILAATLTHVHTRGNQDSLESYLAYVAERIDILNVTRRDLEVSVYGDCAVMTGHQTNTARLRGSDADPVEVEAQVMQVWVKTTGQWQQVAFQATPLGAPPPPLPPKDQPDGGRDVGETANSASDPAGNPGT